MTNALTDAVEASAITAMYNEHCQKLLCFEQVIARILKGAVKEFKSIPVSKIQEYIEGTPQINSHLQSSDATAFEITFSAYAPIGKLPITFRINVEAQQKIHAKYHLLSKSIYYSCRMISSQYDDERKESDCLELQKEYFIWLCLKSSKHHGNCISEYSISKKDLVGITPDQKKQYDKLTMIFIYLNQDMENNCTLTKMLNTLFSQKITAYEKLIKLEDEHSIILTIEQKEVLRNMCDFASLLIENVTEEVTKKVTDDVTKKVTKKVTEKVVKETKIADIKLAAEIARDLGAKDEDIPFIIGKKYKKSAKEILKIIS